MIKSYGRFNIWYETARFWKIISLQTYRKAKPRFGLVGKRMLALLFLISRVNIWCCQKMNYMK